MRLILFRVQLEFEFENTSIKGSFLTWLFDDFYMSINLSPASFMIIPICK